MKRKLLIAIAAVLILTTGVLATLVIRSQQTEPTAATAQFAPAQVPLDATVIFNLVNDERIKAGLQPMARDPRLDATAQARADDMVARNYFAHRDPVTNENMVKRQPQCSWNSENISWNKPPNSADDAKNIVRSWMNSKPHHDAILDSRYTLTGVAVSGDKVAQHFCVGR